MKELVKFAMPPVNSIVAIGDIVVGENNAANQFIDRFGSSWRKAPSSCADECTDKVFVIFDKINDNICFTLSDNVIKAYPGVSRQKFIQAWSDNWCQSLSDLALSFNLDAKFKYTGLQVMQICKNLNL